MSTNVVDQIKKNLNTKKKKKGNGLVTHAKIAEDAKGALAKYASPFPEINGQVIVTVEDLDANLVETLKGRPPKYKPEYCIALIHHMANGLTYGTFSGEINVSRQTINDWEKAYPEFKAAKLVAISKKRGTWEKILSLSAGGLTKGNAASIIFGLKNYYSDDFKDKREVEERSTTRIIIDTGIERAPQQTIETTARTVVDEPISTVEYTATTDDDDPLDGL